MNTEEPHPEYLTVDISVAPGSEQAPANRLLPGNQSLRAWASSAYQGNIPAEVAIRIVDDRESQMLNREYRQQDKPTNVLSFPSGLDPVDNFLHLGDIVICAPVVDREANEQDKSLTDHWAHMTVHGMLHLQGYDHVDAGDAEVMEALESKILARFNITNPYQAGCQ